MSQRLLRMASALPRARRRAMMGVFIVELIGRARCAGCLPQSTISTGARAQGRDDPCSGGCATCGGRASQRWKKRRCYRSPPRRRPAPTKRLIPSVPERPDPHHTQPQGELESASPAANFLPHTCPAPDIVAMTWLDLGRSPDAARRHAGVHRCSGRGPSEESAGALWDHEDCLTLAGCSSRRYRCSGRHYCAWAQVRA